jgi:hypothetical protein
MDAALLLTWVTGLEMEGVLLHALFHHRRLVDGRELVAVLGCEESQLATVGFCGMIDGFWGWLCDDVVEGI